MSERLDALLSARCDGRLAEADRAELDRLLGASEAARERAAQFERVDDSLRSLAERPVADERLARSLAALRGRVAAAAEGRPRSDPAPSRPPRTLRGRAIAVGVAVAALALAAAWIAVLLVPMPSAQDAGDSAVAGDLALLGLEQSDDLEVIGALDLLDFLAEREQRAARPRG